MTVDPKALVARGYDRIADVYLERYGVSSVRERWLRELLAATQPGERVLDLGCGAGIPVARELVLQGREVFGVDGSARQIELAHHNVPLASFRHADMTSVEFPSASFDAVSAFYSIIHVPLDEHAILLRRIATWLRPGGVLVASLGATRSANWRGEWLGTEMFFSHHDADINLRLVADAGLAVVRSELADQDNEDARFLWVLARRPSS